jgi:O-antigen ligase
MKFERSPSASIGFFRGQRSVINRVRPRFLLRPKFKWVIRYCYYAFVFSVPFEMADINPGQMLTISKLIGYLLIVFGCLQPSLCFKKPPKAFWYFVAYLAICTATGAVFMGGDAVDPEFFRLFVIQLFSRVQMLGLFWIAHNLFRQEEVVKGSLIALGLSTVVIVFLQLAGLAGDAEPAQGRVSAFEANPNSIATVLSLGFIAVFGLAYGRENTDWKTRLIFWTTSLSLAAAIVRTGSRGAAVALALSFGVLLFKEGNIGKKFKMGVLGLIGISVLAVLSYQVPSVRDRWEKTLVEGNLAGREKIYPEALQMFVERPLLGWGMLNHTAELGARFGLVKLDPHNMYLFVLTEVGLVGLIIFLIGVTKCWLAAWRARFNIQGITPLMMLSFLLMINMKGSWQQKKLFWFVLAYALASAGYGAARTRWVNPAPRPAFRLRNIPRHRSASRTLG